MIKHPAFETGAWSLRETHLDLGVLDQSESLFALSNGHIGMRGNLDEGEPAGTPGTYLNGFYELHPLASPEREYGNPESGQSIVNVTNGKIIRLLVDDEPFDVRYGELVSHERELDLRAGVLRRKVEWRSPAGQGVRITSTRLVSLAQRAVVAIRYEVEPLGDDAHVVVQSELVANEPLPVSDGSDPRRSAALGPILVNEFQFARDRVYGLAHRTRSSGLAMAVAADHIIEGAKDVATDVTVRDDVARLVASAHLDVGERLVVVKLLGYGWSGYRSVPALVDQCYAAVVQARQTGWDGLMAAQRQELDRYWEGADIELEGDDELALAARVALFHIHQAAYRAERRAIPAKGLTGTGYDGHAFWDSESYVMQVLAYTNPKAASDALRWRASTLDLALARARQLGLEGAAFPWRTIHGEECSGYWPASTAAFHVNADIADAVYRLHWVAEDAEFERSVGAPLVIHTARLWSSLGYFSGREGEGDFHIDGVTGPDEYSAISNNNTFTNLLAQRNLEGAAKAAERLPEVAAALGVTEDEVARWRAAAARMHVPFNAELGVHEQASGSTTRERWDFAHTPPDHYPLLLHYPYFNLYRQQVVKQADLVFALLLCPMSFTAEEKRRAFEYYEPLTVRDSSLSASIQSVIAAEVGHLGLAYDYLCEAALLDLDDLEHNTSDGLHIASLAGTWIALVLGLGGLREHDGKLSFAPRLPDPLTRLCFRLTFRERRLRVDVQPDEARYTIEVGEPLVVRHHGEDVSLAKAKTVARPIAPIPVLPAPSQPPGRAPRSDTDQPVGEPVV